MRLGGTGHQHLENPAAWAWTEQAISEELQKLTPPIIGMTCLAAGADQLVARLVLAVGGEIHAVLPFDNIERTFGVGDLDEFKTLVAKASVEVLSTPGTDEDSYLAAGKRVVDLSDLIFAVWDGLPAKGKGGTADVVAYAIENRKSVVHFNPISQAIARYDPSFAI